ncbi:MAG: hypothetical protein QME81_19685, partial [bacterium]|nr:hypothetical protein [bacterium]
MKNTITLRDTFPTSPSITAFGSDGSFLTSFGEPEVGRFVNPSSPAKLSACYHTQATEDKPSACKPSACPHRQACYQTLSKWQVRRGQYQRPDVTASDRLDIAQRYYAPNRPWGRVVRMAQKYDLSRRTIYDIAEQGAVLFEPRLPGPVPCLKQLLPCGQMLSPPKTETTTLSREEKERQRNLKLLLHLDRLARCAG